MENLVICRDLCKNYGSTPALYNLNLTLDGGKIYGLLGPNGSGKTTFIKILCGLLTPSSGDIIVDNGPVGVHSKSVISYLPDQTYLQMHKTVGEVLEYFKDFYQDFDMARACQMLSDLNIQPKMPIKNMSKGTKEKLQLILVMSRRAKLYVLDEPIAGVDPAARDYILETVLKNYSPESSILISTHLIYDIENSIDHVLFIKQGQVILDGDADAIRAGEGKSIDQLFREVFRC